MIFRNKILNLISANMIFTVFITLGQSGDTVGSSFKNAFYAELVGSAPYLSYNYEHSIILSKHYTIHGRFGLGFAYESYDKSDLIIPSIPFELSVSIGKRKHRAEGGAGITPFFSKHATWSPEPTFNGWNPAKFDYKLYYLLVLRAGYRFTTNKKWLWRLAYTPWFKNSSYKSDFYVTHSFGLSCGKVF